MQAGDFKEWDKTTARISKERGMAGPAEGEVVGRARKESMTGLFFEMAAIVLISACASSS